VDSDHNTTPMEEQTLLSSGKAIDGRNLPADLWILL
jgi:hypothetical protein